MSNILSRVVPLNLLEEKEKFFASSSYNPQFVYRSPITQSEMEQWGKPQEKIYQHAVSMLENLPAVLKDPHELITVSEIEESIATFNTLQKLEIPITTHFSEKYLSRCVVSPPNIYFQLPLVYSHEQFADLYRHELETHVLRIENEKRQPWKETPTSENELRRTEEGLANLHTHLFRKNKILRKSYSSYVAAYLAMQTTFREVFNTLVNYEIAPSTAWNISVKVKRGMTDTSRPGSFTKEVSYLEGALEVWQWLQDRHNDPHHLYWGRISLQQITELSSTAQTTGLRFPSFFADMELYYKNIKEIGVVNKFEELL